MQFLVLIAALVPLILLPASPLVAQTPHIIGMAGARHILVLWSDGSVTGMGDNRQGQLAHPKTLSLDFHPPVNIPLPAKAIRIAACEDASYALLEDGTVWAWGVNTYGQLGLKLSGAPERHQPAPVPGLHGVAALSAEMHMAMAVMNDGSVRAWGQLPFSLSGGRPVHEPIPIPGLANVVSVSGGSRIGFALTRDGRVLSWGVNNLGQLGLGATSKTEPPTAIPSLTGVVSVARVNGSGVAVTRDGRVWTWGHNGQAGLGNGARADTMDPGQPAPQPVPRVAGAIEVKAGPDSGRHILVRRRDRTLIAWGNTDWGQLGTGAVAFQPTPTPIKLAGVENYWAFGNYSFAIATGGAVWFWGDGFAAKGLLGTKPNQRVPARVTLDRLRPSAAPAP